MNILRSTLLYLCFALPSIAQTDSLATSATPSFVIDTIIVSGNEKTETYVILDEMTIKPGDVATPELVEFDKNRIYSLGLFTRVDLYEDTLKGKRFLLVEVKERWYLLPILLAGFRDGDPKKPYFGGGLMDYNFRGKNQRVRGAIVFGFDPSIEFGFSNPLVSREPNLYFSGNLSFSRVRNKSKVESAITGDFDEDHYDFNATFGHRYTLFETAAFTAGFTVVRTGEYRPGRTASATGKDAFIYAVLSYARDSRDLREYPSLGSLISLYVTKNGFGEAQLSFTRFGLDLRKYIPLPLDFTLAARTYGTFASGKFIPTYAHAYFGYGEKIRGYFKDVFEGEDLLGATIELHWPLLKARVIDFTAISIPREFSVWRFGIGLACLRMQARYGSETEPLTFNSFASGYGGGIHFLLPYSSIMRLEYAWNQFGHGQFILDFRSSI